MTLWWNEAACRTWSIAVCFAFASAVQRYLGFPFMANCCLQQRRKAGDRNQTAHRPAARAAAPLGIGDRNQITPATSGSCGDARSPAGKVDDTSKEFVFFSDMQLERHFQVVGCAVVVKTRCVVHRDAPVLVRLRRGVCLFTSTRAAI